VDLLGAFDAMAKEAGPHWPAQVNFSARLRKNMIDASQYFASHSTSACVGAPSSTGAAVASAPTHSRAAARRRDQVLDGFAHFLSHLPPRPTPLVLSSSSSSSSHMTSPNLPAVAGAAAGGAGGAHDGRGFAAGGVTAGPGVEVALGVAALCAATIAAADAVTKPCASTVIEGSSEFGAPTCDGDDDLFDGDSIEAKRWALERVWLLGTWVRQCFPADAVQVMDECVPRSRRDLRILDQRVLPMLDWFLTLEAAS
jgi:hypothetical protein